MSRLTEKTKYGYADKTTGQISEVSDKLGKLEDIEEELGCPLKVLFMALKHNYIYTVYSIMSGLYIKFDELGWTITNGYYKYFLKEYGKTWWLKRDKSE